MQTPTLTRPAVRRAAVGYGALAVVWGISFNVESLPFFPTVVIGGAITAAVGLWVHQAVDASLSLAMRRQDVVLAVVVALVHLAIGHALFALGELVVPQLTDSAAAIYTRTDGVDLVWRILLASLLTAPMEELYWRGALQPLTGHGPLRRIAWTSALYAVFHLVTLKVALVAAAALGGLIWGWLSERTRSLGAVMLAHGLWTAMMLLVPPV